MEQNGYNSQRSRLHRKNSIKKHRNSLFELHFFFFYMLTTAEGYWGPVTSSIDW